MTPDTSSVDAIASLARRHGLRVAVAESLTGGQVSSALAAGPDAGSWYCGGVVAYLPHVKFEVLGVTPGPVVCEGCAREMAIGTAGLLQADVSVALTGVGGPDPEEGEPAGTTYIATSVRGRVECRRFNLGGDPEQVVAGATEAALRQLLDRLRTTFEEAGTAPA